MNVDKAAHAIHPAQSIAPGLQARQPQNSRQDPIPVGKSPAQVGRVNLSGGTPGPEHRSQGLSRANFGAHLMSTAGRATAALFLTSTSARRGYRVFPVTFPRHLQRQRLPFQADENARPCVGLCRHSRIITRHGQLPPRLTSPETCLVYGKA